MKTKNIAILSLAVLAVVLMGATAVSAAGNFKGQKNREANRPVLTDEQKAEMETRREEMKVEREAIRTAIKSGDYNTWKSLEEARQAKQVKISDVINENNFAKFVEMHQLMEDGKMTEAKVIADELGLSNARGMGMGIGMGMCDHGMGHGRGERPEWAGSGITNSIQ